MTEYLKSSLDPKSAKAGFGIVPPDLSLSVRSREKIGYTLTFSASMKILSRVMVGIIR